MWSILIIAEHNGIGSLSAQTSYQSFFFFRSLHFLFTSLDFRSPTSASHLPLNLSFCRLLFFHCRGKPLRFHTSSSLVQVFNTYNGRRRSDTGEAYWPCALLPLCSCWCGLLWCYSWCTHPCRRVGCQILEGIRADITAASRRG